MSTQGTLGTDPAFQLASALQAIEDAEKDWNVQRADHKERMERLYQEAGKLRYEILTGQKQLSLEGSGVDAIVKDFVDEMQTLADRSGITTTISSGTHTATIAPKADAQAD